MFGIGFFKGQPTDYIIHYRSGQPVAAGPGLAFFHLRYRSQIVAVPTQSLDVNFVFNEVTRDYQDVTLQGQITYRIREPFVSRTSAAGIVTGHLGPGDILELTSQMPNNGVIFSDGIETDFLKFDSGTTARIGLADRRVSLVQS
jgi:hypothetical protein